MNAIEKIKHLMLYYDRNRNFKLLNINNKMKYINNVYLTYDIKEDKKGFN